MRSYRRPDVEIETFLDETGDPIPYGHHGWWDDGPPQDAYSRCVHPERFAPIRQVGEALVDHLRSAHDVDVAESIDAGVRTLRLRPNGGQGAPMTLTVSLDGVSAVTLHAGHRFEARWPDCGCDACDEDVADLLDDLESTVLAVAAGRLSEWRTGPDPTSPLVRDDEGRAVGEEVVPWQVHHRLEGVSEGGGWSSDEPEPVELPHAPHQWPAWPLR